MESDCVSTEVSVSEMLAIKLDAWGCLAWDWD
jgi:hypothetical protein